MSTILYLPLVELFIFLRFDVPKLNIQYSLFPLIYFLPPLVLCNCINLSFIECAIQFYHLFYKLTHILHNKPNPTLMHRPLASFSSMNFSFSAVINSTKSIQRISLRICPSKMFLSTYHCRMVASRCCYGKSQ